MNELNGLTILINNILIILIILVTNTIYGSLWVIDKMPDLRAGFLKSL